jgi:hypothetical protein
MSAIERQPRESVTPELVVRARGITRRLGFRWSVSPGAAAQAGLCTPGAREVSLVLAVEIQRGTGPGRATAVSAALVRDGLASPVEFAGASGTAVGDPETGVLHIDIDGFLHATLREPDAVLYARTPLLARLGLPGGRYEGEGLAGER